MKSLTSAAWLVVSPAIRRQFEARHIPTPIRIPVWIHSNEHQGLRKVRLPAALAQGLGYPSAFFTVADASLRPANNLVLHSLAAHAVRRSSRCY